MEHADYQEKLGNLIDNSGYYKTSLHKKYCKICNLPKNARTNINKNILNNIDESVLVDYLLDTYPEIFTARDNTLRCVRSHREYLPAIIDDVQIKSIFKRAKDILKDVNYDDLMNKDKAEIITKIEEELIQEYSDCEADKLSLLTNLFRETLPMMLSRLHEEIVSGSSKDIKAITEATNTVLKVTSALSGAVFNEDEKELKYYDESGKKSSKDNILSLSDRINKAVGKD